MLNSKLESILLTAGAPVGVEKLANVLGEKPEAIRAALASLREEYKERGIRLMANGEEWQFGSAPENSHILQALIKSELGEELSKAGMETIAVIAYKGPITRAEIDYIRGVNSSFTLRNLLLRGLVDRVENPKDARSYLYAISIEFLKYLGVERREDLPEWETWKNFKIPEVRDHESEPE